MSDETTPDTSATPEQQPEPAPTADSAAAESKQQTFDAEYVAKIRAEAARYRTEAKANAEAAKRLAEIEEANKSEAQKQAEQFARLQQENEQLRATALKAQVAADKGVPAELLTGTSEEELIASAERLLAFRGQQQSAPPAEYGRTTDASPTKPRQLTKADLASMSAEEINKAYEAGLLEDVMAGRTR